MKFSALPTRQPVPFATNAASANKRPIPATQPTGSPGAASYSTGFPPETMQPIASGGTPPFGQDFNGLFFDVTNELRWAQAGGTYTYDSAFSASIGGYPTGAVLKSTLANTLWISVADDNTTDPDGASAANWVAFRPNSGRAALAVVSGDLTPTAANLLCCLLSITGDATNLTTTLRLPLVAGASYLVNNATTGTGSTLNVQGATGTGVSVAQGQATVVFCDGTNYYSAGSSGAGQYLPINGTAVAATKLATARAFNLTGVITAAAQNFDGTGNVTFNTAIADGALTIAKTSGLQTALDGKLGLGGGTLTGPVSVSNGTTGAASNPALTIAGGGYSQAINFIPNISAGGYNPLAVAGDAAIIYGNSLNSNQPLTIAPWSSTLGGIRMNGSGQITGGLQFSGVGTSNTDLSKGIALYSNSIGFGITPSRLNYVAPSANAHVFVVNGADVLNVSAGAATLTGNLTVSGAGNFQGSDRRLKRDLVRSEPRPIHRGLRLFDYTMIASGEAGRGVLAQHLKTRAPEYVGQFEVQQGRRKVKRLSVNYAGTALEIALWAANEVDRLTKVVASLQKQLKRLKG